MDLRKSLKRVNRYYLIVLEFPLLLLMIFAFWYSSTHYALMPAQIPTNFGLNGIPDSWSTKSWGYVLSLPVFNIISYIMFSGLTLRQFVHETRQCKPMDGTDMLQRVTIQGIFFVKATIVVAQTYLIYGSTQVALGRAIGLGWLSFVLIFLIVVASLVTAIRIIIISRSNKM